MKDTLLKSSPPLPIKLAAKLVGVPYLNNGTDLNGFDCWGLVWYFYNELGIKTPKPSDYLTRTTNASKDKASNKIIKRHLKKIDNPKSHCVVSFKRSSLAIHAGVYFPELRKVLHAVGNAGVVCEDLAKAQETRGIKGTFYQWR